MWWIWEKDWVFLFCLARNSVLKRKFRLLLGGAYSVRSYWAIIVQFFSIFSKGGLWVKEISRGKKSPGCAKICCFFKSIIWEIKEVISILGRKKIFLGRKTFLYIRANLIDSFCRKMYKWDTLLESFTVCVWFFFVSKGSIKNWSHIIFCLEFSWANSH